MSPVEIKVNGKTFDVLADGSVHQESRSSGVELDEARLQASDIYLAEAKLRGLTRAQHAFWAGVHMRTDVRNLAKVEKRS